MGDAESDVVGEQAPAHQQHRETFSQSGLKETTSVVSLFNAN